MATKVKTQIAKPTTTTANPAVQTKSLWSSTSFDEQNTNLEDSFGASSKSSAAGAPPPEVQLKNAQNSYNFSRYSYQ